MRKTVSPKISRGYDLKGQTAFRRAPRASYGFFSFFAAERNFRALANGAKIPYARQYTKP
jgi:hypothetical protein